MKKHVIIATIAILASSLSMQGMFVASKVRTAVKPARARVYTTNRPSTPQAKQQHDANSIVRKVEALERKHGSIPYLWDVSFFQFDGPDQFAEYLDYVDTHLQKTKKEGIPSPDTFKSAK